MLSGLKKLVMAAVACGALISQTQAQNALAPAASVEPGQTAAPAMWRIADKDSEYILIGTFHILPQGLQWRTPAFNEAFAKADKVYFEVEADTPEARSLTTRVMMTEGFNPQGQALTGMLGQNDAAEFKKIVHDLGLPLAAVDPMRPWQAFLVMSVQFIVRQGFDPSAGVDSVLIGEARTLGKDIHYFETLEQQLGFFTGLDPKTEMNLLVMTIRDWDEQEAEFDDLFNAWREAKVDVIDKEMNDEMRKKAPKVYKTLIIDRNKTWADELARDIKDGSGEAVVAVGAAHLVGADGVPALLKAKGFEVSRYGLDGAPASQPANDNQPQTDAIGDLMKKTAGEE